MEMSKPAAIPLFGDSYMADTMHLTLEEHGAYLRLLMLAWRTDDCSLPDDDRRIARMLGISGNRWKKIRPAVMAFWTLENAKWTQKRLKKERKYVEEKSQKNSKIAKDAWAQRTEKQQEGGMRTQYQTGYETDAPSPSPSPHNSIDNKLSSTVIAKKAQSLPDNFKPEMFSAGTKSATIIETWEHKELIGQIEAFTLHHRKNDTKMKDWQAAWGTWVINSLKFGGTRNGKRTNENTEPVDSMVKAILARRAERAGDETEFL